MPNPYVNKVTVNNATIIDLTADTAIASDVASGKYFHLATGERVAGTASGGGGDTYTLTTVVPQQTLTPHEESNGSYQTTVTYTAGLEDGEYYLVTFDGTEYVCECGLYWSSDYLAGQPDIFWSQPSAYVYPFSLGYTPSVPEFSVGTLDLNQHTIKVEHLELNGGSSGYTNLVPTAVTSAGAVCGYKNGYYVSGSGKVGDFSANASFVATGAMALPSGWQYIYVKGVPMLSGDSHERYYFGDANKTVYQSGGYINATNYASWNMTIETLGTNYYRISSTHANTKAASFVAMSFKTTDGANLIITVDEPIE